MTVKLRNTSGEPLYLGDPDRGGRLIDKDEVVEVEGDLAPKKDQPEDATVVGTGGDARAWPHSIWTVVGAGKKVSDDGG